MDELESNNLFTKNKSNEDIVKRIQRVSENIFNSNIDGGISFTEEKSTIQERMKQNNIPGVCIAIVNKYELEWVKCFGVKDVRSEEPLTLDTIFEIGSASKSFTALAALNLVNTGLLEIDEDLNNKLSTWKISNNEFTKKEKVTLELVLSHRSGINAPNNGFSCEPNSAPSLKQMFNGEKPSLSDPLTVDCEPGTVHAYSNYGYILVQMLLEDIEKKPLHDIVSDYIFEPLGMENSLFAYPSDEIKKQMSIPHDKDGMAREPGLHPTAFAQGGLVLTVSDLCKFYISIMNTINNREESYFSSKVIQHLTTPVLDLDPLKFYGMTGQGLGMFIIDNGKNKFFTHPGSNWPGATCLPIFCAETGQGAIVLTNGILGEVMQFEIINSIAREYGWTLWES
ncbi:MAG: serine hydrolase domain-containing protein [Candidatus Heimdallarchaeaceae archaeon]